MSRKRLIAAFIVIVAAVILLVPDGPAQNKESTRKVSKNVLQRIGVMGASVSAGFGTTLNLAAVLDKAVKGPHETVDVSSSMIFMDPNHWGEHTVERFEIEEVTVAIGLDFFFWYAYGILSPEKRLALLEKGFAYADQIKCPMFVGDIPDMRESVGKMLLADQVPSKEELRALNKRLRKWADERPHVHIISLTQLIDDLKGGEPITLNGRSVTFKKGELVQSDQLHATNKGLAVLTIKILEELAIKYPTIDRKELVLDIDQLVELVEKMPAQKEAESLEEEDDELFEDGDDR